jgi:hypothetical protein
MDWIFDLFPDKYPSLVAADLHDWTFVLGWPRHILEPIDPLLPERSRTCFALELSELDQYVEIQWCRSIPVVFSMFHSRALLAPALAMKSGRARPSTVVHVDAHHDLSACLLGPASAGSLRSDAMNVDCRLDDPETVNNVIDKGYLNKASFLTAYVLATAGAQIIHVDRACQPGVFFLNPHMQSVSIGKVLGTQYSLSFDEIAAGRCWQLIERPELGSVTLDGDREVWLDVDLDAFCNRFDGDSDNHSANGSDAEKNAMAEQISEFLRTLSSAEWLPRVAAISVAASPGFFPSEYWEFAIPRVCNGITELL